MRGCHALGAVLLSLAASAAAAQQTPDSLPTGPVRVDVAGLVADVMTGGPIDGAAISIDGTGLRVYTDSAGRFVLRGIPRGERTWVIERLGYATWRQSLAVQHLDQLKIGLLPRPVDLAAIRVSVDRLEARRKVAPYSVHTATYESLRSAVAVSAADLIRSRMPWMTVSCPGGGIGSTSGVPSIVVDEFCIRYRGRAIQPIVCLDDRRFPMAFLGAYAPSEIHSIDFVGGYSPQVRVYTERFLASDRSMLPLTFPCR